MQGRFLQYVNDKKASKWPSCEDHLKPETEIFWYHGSLSHSRERSSVHIIIHITFISQFRRTSVGLNSLINIIFSFCVNPHRRHLQNFLERVFSSFFYLIGILPVCSLLNIEDFLGIVV